MIFQGVKVQIYGKVTSVCYTIKPFVRDLLMRDHPLMEYYLLATICYTHLAPYWCFSEASFIGLINPTVRSMDRANS